MWFSHTDLSPPFYFFYSVPIHSNASVFSVVPSATVFDLLSYFFLMVLAGYLSLPYPLQAFTSVTMGGGSPPLFFLFYFF